MMGMVKKDGIDKTEASMDADDERWAWGKDMAPTTASMDADG
jgi:hypothetical protein